MTSRKKPVLFVNEGIFRNLKNVLSPSFNIKITKRVKNDGVPLLDSYYYDFLLPQQSIGFLLLDMKVFPRYYQQELKEDDMKKLFTNFKQSFEKNGFVFCIVPPLSNPKREMKNKKQYENIYINKMLLLQKNFPYVKFILLNSVKRIIGMLKELYKTISKSEAIKKIEIDTIEVNCDISEIGPKILGNVELIDETSANILFQKYGSIQKIVDMCVSEPRTVLEDTPLEENQVLQLLNFFRS